jgi:hypothetical protein
VRARLYPSAIFTAEEPENVDSYIGNAASDPRAALRSSLVDWWLLAQCDVLLGPMKSGYARSAVLATSSSAFFADSSCHPCCNATAASPCRGLDVYKYGHSSGTQ